MNDPTPKALSARARGGRGPLLLLAAGVLAYGGFQLTMALVRSHTNGRIQGTVDRPMPAFRLETTEGATLDSATLKGKTVVLNFFRSRCEACDREQEAVRELARSVDPAKVAVLGILCDRLQGYPPAESAATLRRMAFEHPVLWADAAFADAFHGAGWTNVTPITYVVDGGGTIRRALRGAQSLAALRSALP